VHFRSQRNALRVIARGKGDHPARTGFRVQRRDGRPCAAELERPGVLQAFGLDQHAAARDLVEERPPVSPPASDARPRRDLGRMGDDQHLRAIGQRRRRRPTASAVAPPTPRSISSKISVSPGARVRQTFSASRNRLSSPPEAMRFKGPGGAPGLVATVKATAVGAVGAGIGGRRSVTEHGAFQLQGRQFPGHGGIEPRAAARRARRQVGAGGGVGRLRLRHGARQRCHVAGSPASSAASRAQRLGKAAQIVGGDAMLAGQRAQREQPFLDPLQLGRVEIQRIGAAATPACASASSAQRAFQRLMGASSRPSSASPPRSAAPLQPAAGIAQHAFGALRASACAARAISSRTRAAACSARRRASSAASSPGSGASLSSSATAWRRKSSSAAARPGGRAGGQGLAARQRGPGGAGGGRARHRCRQRRPAARGGRAGRAGRGRRAGRAVPPACRTARAAPRPTGGGR
jgi:hypothetical protein